MEAEQAKNVDESFKTFFDRQNGNSFVQDNDDDNDDDDNDDDDNDDDEENERRLRSKAGPSSYSNDLDRADPNDGSLLRSLLSDTKQRTGNDQNIPEWNPNRSDHDLGLENIIGNILDLRDDDLYRLLVT